MPGSDPADGDFVDTIPLAALEAGAQHSVYVGMRRVLLCRVDTDVFAFRDACPHALQPLKGGAITGTTIRCPKHGACFDMKTGMPQNGITKASLELYAVRIRDGIVQVDAGPDKRPNPYQQFGG